MLSVSTQIAGGDDLQVFARMLDSVSFAGEIIIFNMERSDEGALKLFKKYATRVINVKTPTIVESIRNTQVKEASGDWVLIMDYDEVITPELAEEIKQITSSHGACSLYSIPRNNYSLGYPLNHGGWEQDSVVRLIRKKDFIGWPENIHSTPHVKGSKVSTVHAMKHYKDPSLSEMIKKTNRYSDIEAKQFMAGGLPPVTIVTLFRKPIMEFVRRYFLKKGILDGKIGLIQSLYQSYSVFITYAKLFELQNQSSSTNTSLIIKDSKNQK